MQSAEAGELSLELIALEEQYGAHNYPAPAHGQALSQMTTHGAPEVSSKHQRGRQSNNEPRDLFPDLPEGKKRKFILVDDNVRGSRLRVPGARRSSRRFWRATIRRRRSTWR